jgi:hypothetical protein
MHRLIRYASVPLLVGTLAGGIAACGPAQTHHVTASQSAAAKSDAKALTKCLPKSALGQIELAKSLTSHSGREALIAKCGIPASKKQATEAQLLDAAEHGSLATKGGRTIFFNSTLPRIIEANQA